MKKLLLNRFLVLGVVGALVGLAFVYLCRFSGGTCMLLGNPVSGMAFGALVGLLAASG